MHLPLRHDPENILRIKRQVCATKLKTSTLQLSCNSSVRATQESSGRQGLLWKQALGAGGAAALAPV